MIAPPTIFLSRTAAEAHLGQGGALQQWLRVVEEDGFRFIHWLQVEPVDSGWTVFSKVCLDAGDPTHRDMTEFASIGDPDQPEGALFACATTDEVMATCLGLGGKLERFVPFCEIQVLYDAYVSAHGYAERSAREYFSEG